MIWLISTVVAVLWFALALARAAGHGDRDLR